MRLQLVDVRQQQWIRAVESVFRIVEPSVSQQQADLRNIIKAIDCASSVPDVHTDFNRLGACPAYQKQSGELSALRHHDCHSLMM